MQNYIVILKLPRGIENKIKTSYEETFDRKVPISNLHLTLLPPFSLKEKGNLKILKENLKSVKNIEIKANFKSPDLFSNPGETILFLPVEPEKEIVKLHNKLSKVNKNLINFETSLYQTDEVPPFLPHVSLDYDFTFNSQTLLKLKECLKIEDFKLTKPILMVQRSSGNWTKLF